ncbi:cysteine hydrolase family protein [Atopobacter phocae]|uniref:cysteine hydrolase family protein n=1 Tax=Atopobacter phocae TaxID=136492 RepID=UPI00046EFB94|nr:isochorismatase family cysteine hydrolase [Atopobacter phocae]
MKAYIVTDYTEDFIATNGKLTTDEAGQKLEQYIVEQAEKHLNEEDYIVFAVDIHDPSDQFHPENKLFPPHNVEGTSGRNLYGTLNDWYQVNKDSDQVYWMDKRHYSSFSGTDLDVRLRERRITEVVLVGVCTDICILHTAVDAYNLGYDITVLERGVASFDPHGHEWALNHFKNILGATIK